MANLHRAEVEIVIDGETRTMRATFDALCPFQSLRG